MLESLFNKFIGFQAYNFTKRRLQHRRFPFILQTLRTPISKNICERLVLIVAKRIGLLFILKHKIIPFYLLSFVFIGFITRCHSLSLIVIFYYLLSFVVPVDVIRCHSLSFVVPLVVICCHSLLFGVT